MVHRVSTEVGGRTLTLETGRLAGLADGAVLVQYGETVVLTTVVTSTEPREGIDFFPLQVEFEERMYAAGKIPGGFIKRESRPTETGHSRRPPDRPPHPPALQQGLPQRRPGRLQVMSTDQKNDPAILSIIGASRGAVALDLPWTARRRGEAGLIEGEIVVNPTMPGAAYSDLDLTLAATADALLMVEAGARELPEDAAGSRCRSRVTRRESSTRSFGPSGRRRTGTRRPRSSACAGSRAWRADARQREVRREREGRGGRGRARQARPLPA